MKRLFSREIEQRAYEEQPQDFEEYWKETLVCKWKKDKLVENL
jgi:cephalosporin-C deacetylase-like acetyl esterase